MTTQILRVLILLSVLQAIVSSSGGAERVQGTGSDGSCFFGWSSDGKILALTNEYDTSVKLWDVEKRQTICLLKNEEHGRCPTLRFSRDNKKLVCTSSSETNVWNLVLRELLHRSIDVETVAFASDNKTAVFLEKIDQSPFRTDQPPFRTKLGLVVRDLTDYKELLRPKCNSEDPCPLAMSRDGKQLAILETVTVNECLETQLVLFSTDSWKARVLSTGRNLPSDVCFSPVGQRIALCSLDGIEVWDWEKSKMLWRLHSDNAPEYVSPRTSPYTCNYSANGEFLTITFWSGTPDGKVVVLDGQSSRELATIPKRNIVQAEFSPDGRYLALGSLDEGCVYLWTMDELRSLIETSRKSRADK